MKKLSMYNENDLSAFTMALGLIEKNPLRRLATLEDLIEVRATSDESWNRWYTTASTFWLGTSSQGEWLLVIAHHLGPLTTVERFEQWRKSGWNDEGSGRLAYGWKGSLKIEQKEFEKLLKGEYGEVSVFPVGQHVEDMEVILSHSPKLSAVKENPILKALLGRSGDKFLDKHFQISSARAKEERKQAGAEEKIIRMEIRDHCGCDMFFTWEEDWVNLAIERNQWPEQPIGGPIVLQAADYWGNNDLSVSTTISCRPEKGGVKFVILTEQEGEGIYAIEADPLLDLKKCSVPDTSKAPTFVSLRMKKGKFFVEYPKEGNGMDTGLPKHEVLSIEPIGEETSFQTDECLFFLRYGIKEVKKVAPPEANAYLITGSVSPGKVVNVPVQFYKVTFDSSKRILTPTELYNNFDLLCEINGVK